MRFINRWVIFFILIISLIGTFYYTYDINQQDDNQRIQDLLFTITTSLTAGLIIALIQFLLDWKKHYQSEQLHILGVKKILSNREDEDYYRDKISESQDRLWILGNTSSRLLKDFADDRISKEKRRALIKALERGVEVKILVADKRHLATPKEKASFDVAKNRFREIKSEFPDKFNFKYYSHQPNHSIFVFDNECFVGPIFKGLKSRDTPSIYTQTNKDFAKNYLSHFEDEWKNAKN